MQQKCYRGNIIFNSNSKYRTWHQNAIRNKKSWDNIIWNDNLNTSISRQCEILTLNRYYADQSFTVNRHARNSNDDSSN